MESRSSFGIGNRVIVLNRDEGTTFCPNLVTRLVYESVNVQEGDIGIEIGAGIGPGTIYLGSNDQLKELYAVEPSEENFKFLELNLLNSGLNGRVTAMRGFSFNPLKDSGIKADFIVSDASGMDEAGAITGWYPAEGVPLGGYDGAEVTAEILRNAPDYLNRKNPEARVYFPIIPHFSNAERIIETASANFRNVNRIIRKDIPITAEVLEKLNGANYKTHTDFGEKGTRKLWSAEVWIAKNPSK